MGVLAVAGVAGGGGYFLGRQARKLGTTKVQGLRPRVLGFRALGLGFRVRVGHPPTKPAWKLHREPT